MRSPKSGFLDPPRRVRPLANRIRETPRTLNAEPSLGSFSTFYFLLSNCIKVRVNFVTHHFFQLLTFANERELVSPDERLGGKRTGIVIGRHDESVGTGTHDR